MLYIVKVEVIYHPYLQPPSKPTTEIFPVQAESDDEVREILDNHYKDMNSSYESYYQIRILSVNRTLFKK